VLVGAGIVLLLQQFLVVKWKPSLRADDQDDGEQTGIDEQTGAAPSDASKTTKPDRPQRAITPLPTGGYAKTFLDGASNVICPCLFFCRITRSSPN